MADTLEFFIFLLDLVFKGTFLVIVVFYSILQNQSFLGISWGCLAFPSTHGYPLYYLVFYAFPCI